MRLSVRTIGLGILSCCFALAFAACGADREGGGAPADPDMPEPGVESPLAGEIALPEGFPSDVPRYPDAELISVNVHGADMLVSFETTGDPREVADRLERDFASHGWSAKTFHEDVGSSIFADKEGRDATVMVTRAAGKARIDLFLGR
ncbi:MAG: hypothetical protein OEM05_05735 [Myxococcales bacterium]|nr:hypothetical protein [Myxococcales bacterium]